MHRSGRTTKLILALLIGVGPGGAGDLCAQAIDDAKARKVQAAYLYNFAKFIEWPATAFAKEDDPFVIGVLGRDPFGDVLDRTVKGKTIRRHPIKVVRLKRDAIRDGTSGLGCHLLFVCDSENAAINKILHHLTGTCVLTVSDLPRFARRGGMIGLVFDERRIVFEVDRAAVKQAQLVPSSRLLGLARIISSDDQRPEVRTTVQKSKSVARQGDR